MQYQPFFPNDTVYCYTPFLPSPRQGNKWMCMYPLDKKSDQKGKHEKEIEYTANSSLWVFGGGTGESLEDSHTG